MRLLPVGGVGSITWGMTVVEEPLWATRHHRLSEVWRRYGDSLLQVSWRERKRETGWGKDTLKSCPQSPDHFKMYVYARKKGGTSGVTITFSSCTVKVSAHAYIYPAIVKFCPDMGLHKTIVNIGNHTAVNVGASLPMLSWLCLKIWNNLHQVCQWSSDLHSSMGTTSPLNVCLYCITKNHTRASCAWVMSEIHM